jgi:hypothetical protein
MTDHVQASAILELVFSGDLEMTNKKEYDKLVARVEFLSTHIRKPLSELAVGTQFRIKTDTVYIIVKKGTKYAYIRDIDNHEVIDYRRMGKRYLDEKVYVANPKS